MASIKILILLLALISTQLIFAQPIEDRDISEESSEEDDFKFFKLLTALSVNGMLRRNIDKVVDVSRKILKDKDLLANDKPEVIEFRNNVTKLVEDYDGEGEDLADHYREFVKYTNYYLRLPKEKETPESKFIADILNKYNVKEIRQELLREFERFVVKFNKKFVPFKDQLKKPVLDWYEKFITINDAEEKLSEFGWFFQNT